MFLWWAIVGWLCLGASAGAVEAPSAPSTSAVRFTTGGEVRYRMERRDDFTFNDGAFEDDTLHLLRTRLHAELAVGERWRAFIQGQDAESFASSRLHRTNSFVNQLDLRQLFLEARSPLESLPIRLTVGRQELAYGDERFVGAFGWSNVARVFDAVRLRYAPSEATWMDAWASQVVPANRVRPDAADHGEMFYGVYASMRPLEAHTLDLFLFIRNDRDRGLASERPAIRGPMTAYTLGSRFVGRRGPVDYGTEGAWQFGSRAHDALRAWAWHGELGYTLVEVAAQPRLSVELNHGSGDDDPTDGTVENFDNLFPTNHSYYGYMDLASLRNMTNVRLGVDAKPHPRVKLTAAHHWFFLDSSKSAWFNAGQGVIRAATPNASRTVGQEVDLLAAIEVRQNVKVLVGYSHFHAGPFVADSGTSDDANFLYAQAAIRF